ncbi:MAG: GntR family transcriptional regulator [Bradyrhizobium sp.]|uniref:GntR family transcriptional regulator n=1 Tax=Bradyrhizobium sp. TaxID=376 RepID=UPI0027173FBE|nr:GntR family transcriptional regulator [Bradyrhizobium sp.]MDO8399528.1 GntR family transcriptional regulator [Bradyrhizobium sp.]
MDSPQIASRRATPHSADRLDRDRQAAPQVFERLRDMIVSLKLPPGSPLSRAALATQFGVSSTPIRDALMRLEEEGLVDVFPQHATVVSRIDVRLAQQAHFLRQALELEIVKALALEHVDALIDELNGTIALQQKFTRAGDFEKFMAADNDFHAQLYAATGNRALWDLVRSRSGHIDRLRRLHLPSPGKAQDIVRHHKLIVAAISANQPDEAQRHLRQHLSGTLGYLAEIRARFPEYLSE